MIKKTILAFQGVMLSAILFAQDAKPAPVTLDQLVQDNILWILVGVIAFLAAVIIWLLVFVKGMLKYIPKDAMREEPDAATSTEPEPEATSIFFTKVKAALTNAIPMEREKEIEMAHEYDGIRELDNSLPPWWKYLFYITIIFSCVYLYRYHVSYSAPLSLQEYEQEMADAEMQKAAYLEKSANMVNESSVTAMTESSDLANGKKTFTTYCVPCHGGLGEGGVGPNLTDEFWLHGGGIANVFKTIKYGVPEKGMISWQTQLRPKQMQEVGSYILTLQGSNPPNGKAPQGEKYISEITAEAPANDTIRQ